MDAHVLLVDDHPDTTGLVYFGGLPSVPAGSGFDWPRCGRCHLPMQYLGRVPHPGDPLRRILLFQCANDPSLCDNWRLAEGASSAVVIEMADPMVTVMPPYGGVTMLPAMWSGHAVADPGPYHLTRSFDLGFRHLGRRVLGQVGGQPEWLQAGETPRCPGCGRLMMLAAQIEEGPDYRTAINFGGSGSGYIFVCGCPANQARFLWQCD